jgi:tetratricopeptide (TPR) repeat protein
MSAKVGATPQTLAIVFLLMVLLFVATGFYTRSFNAERRARARMHFEIAKTLADYGYYEDALEQYRDALTYERDNVDYRLGLAVALYRLGSYQEAENYLTDIRANYPNRGMVNRLLARIAAHDGRVDEAISHYRNAIYGRWLQNPEQNRLRTRFELVELLEKSGEERQLMGELLDLLAEAPDNPETKSRIGWLFLKVGSAEQASKVFEDLTRANPQKAEFYVGRGKAEFDLGNFLTARTQFRRAIELEPADQEVRRLLELTNQISALDPTSRGTGLSTRYARSRTLVSRSLKLLEACTNPLGRTLAGPPAPLPKSIQSLLEKARGIATGKAPQRTTEETVEANISLAQELWSTRAKLCPNDEMDEALRQVLEKLSR